MLFPTESKAVNFIKYNAHTILEEEGYAPKRAYYCDTCCGFHVTSSSVIEPHYTYAGKKDIHSYRTDKEIEVIKDISKAFEFIKMAGSAFKNKLYFDSRRFLCYAEYFLKKHENTYVQYERNMQLQALASDHLKNLIKRIMRERKHFGNTKDKTVKQLIKDQSASVEYKEVDVDGKYSIRCIPELMFQNSMESIYVYKLWRGRLTQKEYEETLLANNMSDNERIEFIHENVIGIVDAVRDDTLKRKSQYHSIKELFKNLVIASYIDCKKLKVYELGAQSHRPSKVLFGRTDMGGGLN